MILGIDIGGTSSKMGLVSEGKVLRRLRIPTPKTGTAEHFVDVLVEAVSEIKGDDELTAVGVGAPNGNQLNGCIEDAPNLIWKGSIPLARMLSDKLGIPCVLGNDANAAALGVATYGVGSGSSDILVVTLGTGLGSGMIVDSKLFIGPRGNAAELGHTNAVIDGRPCTCGCKGCLESYVSIRGIRQTYSELGGNGQVLDSPGVKPIAAAANEGQDIAIQTFTDTARWLSTGLSSAVAMLAPSKIVLFGGIARSGDVLIDPLRKMFEEKLMPMHRGKVEIEVSQLPEDDAAILGAAALTYS